MLHLDLRMFGLGKTAVTVIWLSCITHTHTHTVNNSTTALGLLCNSAEVEFISWNLWLSGVCVCVCDLAGVCVGSWCVFTHALHTLSLPASSGGFDCLPIRSETVFVVCVSVMSWLQLLLKFIIRFVTCLNLPLRLIKGLFIENNYRIKTAKLQNPEEIGLLKINRIFNSCYYLIIFDLKFYSVN